MDLQPVIHAYKTGSSVLKLPASSPSYIRRGAELCAELWAQLKLRSLKISSLKLGIEEDCLMALLSQF